MSKYKVEASAIIDAPIERVYSIIADYNEGHPSILPARYFTNLQVTQGGRGAGTQAIVDMNVFGTKARYHISVSEPEPGRVIAEQDSAAGLVTTFTLNPLREGTQTQVTISTTASLSPGFKGWLEKLVTPGITRRIYRDELAQLAQVVQLSTRM